MLFAPCSEFPHAAFFVQDAGLEGFQLLDAVFQIGEARLKGGDVGCVGHDAVLSTHSLSETNYAINEQIQSRKNYSKNEQLACD